jgi:hypothetical protein
MTSPATVIFSAVQFKLQRRTGRKELPGKAGEGCGMRAIINAHLILID